MDFDVPADHLLDIKENKQRDKYIDFVRQLEKLSNMKVTVIPIKYI